jgi:hypothetical protein
VWRLWVCFPGSEWALVISDPDRDALERFARAAFPGHRFSLVWE